MTRQTPHFSLIATDMAQSVYRNARVSKSYTPFGYLAGRQPEPAFTGQRREADFYLMGSGRRAYSPTLLRFFSADGASPFGRGGLNAYAYCSGDPINRQDRGGASWASLLGKLVKSAKAVTSPRASALELAYAGAGKGKTLRFFTTEVAEPTQMYESLGAHLSGSQGSFAVMARNAKQLKLGAKSFEAIPSYAPLRDPSLFEQAIDKQHASIWANEAIKPVGPGDWPALPIGPLNLKDSDVRRTVLSYLYYQELADPAVVRLRGRVDPWSQQRQ